MTVHRTRHDRTTTLCCQRPLDDLERGDSFTTIDGEADCPANRMDPDILARLVEDMHTLANNVDQADAESFAADEPWAALQRALESMEKLSAEADLYRPVTSLP